MTASRRGPCLPCARADRKQEERLRDRYSEGHPRGNVCFAQWSSLTAPDGLRLFKQGQGMGFETLPTKPRTRFGNSHGRKNLG